MNAVRDIRCEIHPARPANSARRFSRTESIENEERVTKVRQSELKRKALRNKSGLGLTGMGPGLANAGTNTTR